MNITVSNISVPRIARNKRIYAGNTGGSMTVNQSSQTVLDWVSVSEELVQIDRSLAVEGDLTIQNLAGNSGYTIIVDENGTLATKRAVYQEIPSGIIDNANTIFTLANIPILNSEFITLNGLHLKRGVDYTILDDTITFINPPYTDSGYTDAILVDYYYLTYSSGGNVPTAASIPYTLMNRGSGASATGYDLAASRIGRTITITGEFILTPNTPSGTIIASLPVETIAAGMSLTRQIKSFYTEVSNDNDNRGVKFYVDIFDPISNPNMELKSYYEFDGETTPVWITLTFNVI